MKWEQEHLSEGRYTLEMVRIDDKVREIISKSVSKTLASKAMLAAIGLVAVLALGFGLLALLAVVVCGLRRRLSLLDWAIGA